MPRITMNEANNALKCLKARKGHRLIIVFDSAEKQAIANKIRRAARRRGIRTKLIDIRELFQKGNERYVLQEIESQLSRFFGRASHKEKNAITLIGNKKPYASVRGKIVRKILEQNGYVLHIPTDNTNVIKNLLALNPNELEKRGNTLIERLKNARSIIITTEAGTNLTIPWHPEKRSWVLSVGKVKDYSVGKGGWGNPGGEVFTSPIHEGVRGKIVVDGSFGNFGLVKEPIEIEFDERGRAILSKIKHDGIRKKLSKDKNACRLGELGIGLVPGELIGDTLFDEKKEGTIHVAFGHDESERGTGGENESEIHEDAIIMNPTVVVVDHKGKKHTIMNKGKLCV
ncbi:MAG: aminopeptidase [Candidatus Diapherotrites archaeon]|nr:aminopeptidase [Candidatus Diapherotrites archaeon]